MFKTLTTAVALAFVLTGTAFAAESEGGHIENIKFSFDGPFGSYDQMQLQRGLKIYTEVCSACHGLRYVPLRTLGDEGGSHYSKAEVRAYAEQNYEVFDPELLDGEGDFRAALPADNFPANDGVGAPDLSMMAKARAGFHGPYGLGINQFFKGMGGPEYIVALLNGYTGDEKEEAGTVLYENTVFPGGWISMGPPLDDEMVDFDDGHANDLHHMSEDIAAFLMWSAEPKLNDRKVVGLRAVMILGLLTVLLYFTNKRLWAPIKGRSKG